MNLDHAIDLLSEVLREQPYLLRVNPEGRIEAVDQQAFEILKLAIQDPARRRKSKRRPIPISTTPLPHYIRPGVEIAGIPLSLVTGANWAPAAWQRPYASWKPPKPARAT
jgi:hypothetical protein